MKLYHCPGTCSQASLIALTEAGLRPELVRVDVRTRTLADGSDYGRINPKGYVPALVLDDGTMLTETVAILHWAARQAPHLRPRDAAAETRLLEWLAFLSTEIQKPFVCFFTLPESEIRDALRNAAGERLALVAQRMTAPWLTGEDFGVADALLFVMLKWADAAGADVPPRFAGYRTAIAERAAVREALSAEGSAW